MILQSKGGCYLTEAADVKIEQRHFAQTVYLGAADEALAWREVTEAEKEKMLQQGTVFDTSQLSGEYLDKVDALMLAIPAQINDAAPLPEAEALEHIGWYPEWGDENAPMGKEVDAGFRRATKADCSRSGSLTRCKSNGSRARKGQRPFTPCCRPTTRSIPGDTPAPLTTPSRTRAT